jgi:selenocysteine-specific elongation factor
MILGTAGHIDHGKTSLIKALTGVDTDRLPEEKRRGITIELGFAPLELPDVGVIGIVDVPGHEAFVRTMVAGASGIDLALLVIAADEGVMPQTREHLAVLSLLGIRAGLVVLTKSDLVDADWLELVEEDTRAFLVGSPLEGCPIIPASVVSGKGLDEIRATIRELALSLPGRSSSDLFRLPIDRAFSVRGTGTVVTGTVWSGEVRREAVLHVSPGGRSARVRSVQSHGAQVDAAQPGARAALALVGVDLADVARGSVVVGGDGWAETRQLRADVRLLPDATASLGPRTSVRFHLGTADVGARVVVAGGPLLAGQRRSARVVLDEPLLARSGDRFVIRSATPLATIGGGVVVDPQPLHRRARPWPLEEGSSVPGRLRLALEEAGAQGVAISALPVRLGLSVSGVTELIAGEAERVTRLGDRVFDRDIVTRLTDRLVQLVEEHHARYPLDVGVSLQSVRARLAAPAPLVEEVLRESVTTGAVELDAGVIRRAGWVPRLTAEQRTLVEQLAQEHKLAEREPPSAPELSAKYGDSVPHLLRILERDGRLVQIEPERYYDRGAVTLLVLALRTGMEKGREYSPAELRELLGVSRKYLIPFLEYCDRHGVTERRSAGRVLHGT